MFCAQLGNARQSGFIIPTVHSHDTHDTHKPLHTGTRKTDVCLYINPRTHGPHMHSIMCCTYSSLAERLCTDAEHTCVIVVCVRPRTCSSVLRAVSSALRALSTSRLFDWTSLSRANIRALHTHTHTCTPQIVATGHLFDTDKYKADLCKNEGSMCVSVCVCVSTLTAALPVLRSSPVLTADLSVAPPQSCTLLPSTGTDDAQDQRSVASTCHAATHSESLAHAITSFAVQCRLQTAWPDVCLSVRVCVRLCRCTFLSLALIASCS